MFLRDQILKCLFIKIGAVDIKAFIYGAKQIWDVVELNLCFVPLMIMNQFKQMILKLSLMKKAYFDKGEQNGY